VAQNVISTLEGNEIIEIARLQEDVLTISKNGQITKSTVR